MHLQSWAQAKARQYAKKKKQLKRKVFLFKARVVLLYVLPVVIVLLAAKTAKTLIRVKLRDAAASVPVKKPVTQTSSKPEFITPQPVARTARPQASTAQPDSQT